MASGIGSAVTGKVVERVTGPAGLNAGLAALTADDSELAALAGCGKTLVKASETCDVENVLGV